jgi:hypothetical protein
MTTREGESQVGEQEYRIRKTKGILVFSFIFCTKRSCFTKRDTKTAPAPPEEPFMEPEKKMPSLVK